MTGLIVLFVLGVVCLLIGGAIANEEPTSPTGWVYSLLGIGLLAALTFLGAPISLHTGSPVTSIDAGEYQVAFVYVAGDNVSVGIEQEDHRFGDGVHLFLYQFPGNAFEDGVKGNALKLVVTESGEFKKLQLE